MQRAITEQSVAGADFFERVDTTTKLQPSNRGYQLLLKMGWKAGGTLGAEGNDRGLKEPIVVNAYYNGLGLGKKTQDDEVSCWLAGWLVGWSVDWLGDLLVGVGWLRGLR